HCPRLAIGTLNGCAAVLRKINAAHAVCFVRSAAMKHITIKCHDTARRNNERVARIWSRVSDEIVRALFLVMINDLALGASTRVRQNIDCAVFFVHGVQSAPTSHVRLMICAWVVPLHVTAVLMPGELHPLLRALHDPLFVE